MSGVSSVTVHLEGGGALLMKGWEPFNLGIKKETFNNGSVVVGFKDKAGLL